ncbi:ABC-type transporter Mla subunit MlaD [Nocardia tenerifensis]|uniref:ABC-type transporter Mla subunit MlaD n=1 Tax=Nocardia tenerifensis TaxID=228006 RepID=A0A318JTB9_9NOCA|nr:MlaD family protein [Nocardia tenerifensis]PXX58454.1 ABC-type transporter Mla subunit MlaD [Nocardia tenerifensis]
MPAFGLPGVATDARLSRRIGIVVVAVAVLMLIGWRMLPSRNDGTLSVAVLTDKVGTGLKTGNNVRLDGVAVGRVSAIESAGQRQRITLTLHRDQLFGLTDAFGVDYVPGNLFGVAEIALERGPGGAALADGAVVDLTGARAGQVRDATISTLLRSVGTFSNEVLSPELISILDRISSGTSAFTPLIEAVVASVRAIAETQRLPSSFLLGQYGATLAGLPSTTHGLLGLLSTAYDAEYLRSPENLARFDASTQMIVTEFIPALATVLSTAETHFADTVSTLVPVLAMLTRTVPDPARSGVELGELLRRLGAALPDTADGPVLNLAVDLRGVPGLAVPLLGGVR